MKSSVESKDNMVSLCNAYFTVYSGAFQLISTAGCTPVCQFFKRVALRKVKGIIYRFFLKNSDLKTPSHLNIKIAIIQQEL